MKNVLITGASGMLGATICNYFSHNKSFRVFAVGGSDNSFVQAEKYLVGDLTRQAFIDTLAKFEFDAIVHCAALTDIEKCETKPDIANQINTKATENLAKIFSKSIFIYTSTDSVFDGKTGNYDENDEPNPVNVYAQTKLAGEQAVTQFSEKHYILRTNMYGFHRPLTNRSLFEWAYKNLSKGLQMHGFSNVIFNPLYVGQLAKIIEILIGGQIDFGIYNAACNNHLSKLTFLEMIARIFDFSEDLITPLEISEKPFNAVRPFRTFLKNDKITEVLPEINFSIEHGFQMLYDDLLKFEKQ